MSDIVPSHSLSNLLHDPDYMKTSVEDIILLSFNAAFAYFGIISFTIIMYPTFIERKMPRTVLSTALAIAAVTISVSKSIVNTATLVNKSWAFGEYGCYIDYLFTFGGLTTFGVLIAFSQLHRYMQIHYNIYTTMQMAYIYVVLAYLFSFLPVGFPLYVGAQDYVLLLDRGCIPNFTTRQPLGIASIFIYLFALSSSISVTVYLQLSVYWLHKRLTRKTEGEAEESSENKRKMLRILLVVLFAGSLWMPYSGIIAYQIIFGKHVSKTFSHIGSALLNLSIGLVPIAGYFYDNMIRSNFNDYYKRSFERKIINKTRAYILSPKRTAISKSENPVNNLSTLRTMKTQDTRQN